MAVTADLIAADNAKHAFHGVTLAKAKVGETGVVIAAVAPDSPAAEAGLQPGDVIKSDRRHRRSPAAGFSAALLERQSRRPARGGRRAET